MCAAEPAQDSLVVPTVAWPECLPSRITSAKLGLAKADVALARVQYGSDSVAYREACDAYASLQVMQNTNDDLRPLTQNGNVGNWLAWRDEHELDVDIGDADQPGAESPTELQAWTLC
mmetsp:Transcript_25018/g.59090  ORF Transcript_25018/g.59090 Transcript_25018/m.59090 type:complete len:118 (+) Transcript_25018:42-395(+)